jgi:hypothetical protein
VGNGGRPAAASDSRSPAWFRTAASRCSHPLALLPICDALFLSAHLLPHLGVTQPAASSDEGFDMVVTQARVGTPPCYPRPPLLAASGRREVLSRPWWKAMGGHTDAPPREGHGYRTSTVVLQYVDDGATLGRR